MNNINFNHVHFIGIGGIGMSGIADILIDLGYQVSGSDSNASSVTDRLENKGGVIHVGQRAENITTDIDLVVRSTAIKDNNIEINTAIELGIPIIHRADMLAFLMLDKRAICVAGAHGKTTTSSMVALMLELNAKDPTIVVGGEISQIGSNAKYGTGDLLVAEADESDGSFLKLHPWMIIVTNIEEDHLDHYQDLAEIKAVFTEFIKMPGVKGIGIFCIDCTEVRDILDQAPGKIVTYGFSENAQIRAVNWRQEAKENKADVYWQGEFLGKLVLRVPGKHNICNALAAVAAGLCLDMTFVDIAQSLSEFTGAKRRFQILGEVNGVRVVDDYAHHPTEIRATLQAARGGHDGRIVAIFQPHRYSRTKFLARDFAQSFTDADKVILTDVYSAGEAAIDGAGSELILSYMPEATDVKIIKRSQLNQLLLREVQSGDLVLMLGAGNIWQNAAQLVEDLKTNKNIW